LAVALTLEQVDALTARVESLEKALAATQSSSGALRIHGPILPEPMPPHVANDPDEHLRAETRRKRKLKLTFDAIWDNHSLDVIQRGSGLWAEANRLKMGRLITHGYRDHIEAPIREEEAHLRGEAA
jgi:hypothetical protein